MPRVDKHQRRTPALKRQPAKPVAIDAIEYDEDLAELPLSRGPSPVQRALAALDAIDRRVVFQEVTRQMMHGLPAERRHVLARQLAGTLLAAVNEGRW